MVAWLAANPAVVTWLQADAAKAPLLDRLDPATRGKVLLALAGLVILGGAMILVVWLLFRNLKRQQAATGAVLRGERHSEPAKHDWAQKPLASATDEGTSRD